MPGSVNAEVQLSEDSLEPEVETLALGYDAHAVTPLLPVTAVKIQPKFQRPMGVADESFGKRKIAQPGYRLGLQVGIHLTSLGSLVLLGHLILLGCRRVRGISSRRRISGRVGWGICGGICPGPGV